MSTVITGESDDTTGQETRHMIELLECRYGDGTVYLPKTKTYRLLNLALGQGLIDTEGYLTRKGRTLLARHYS